MQEQEEMKRTARLIFLCGKSITGLMAGSWRVI